MASKGQITGMYGVYLVAAKLSERGLIASPTSRGAKGADILVTTDDCSRTWVVQVKANRKPSNFFLVGKAGKKLVAKNYFYVLVNIDKPEGPEYFVVPSRVIAKNTIHEKSSTGSEWWSVMRDEVENYREKWDLFA